MMTDVLFNPSRLTLARKRRGLTMLKLASLIGVESRSISAYEKDEFRPEMIDWPHLLRYYVFRSHFSWVTISMNRRQMLRVFGRSQRLRRASGIWPWAQVRLL